MAGEIVGSARIIIEPDMGPFDRVLSSDVQAAAERAAASMERAFNAQAAAAAQSVDRIETSLQNLDTNIAVGVTVADEQLEGLERQIRPLTDEEQQVVLKAQITEAQRAISRLDQEIGKATEPEEIRVLVDQRGEAVRKLNQLESEVEDVGEELQEAAGSSDRLGQALAAIGFATVARGLFEVAQGASELEQSVGGTETLFGEASRTIDDFADVSAASFGLTAREARNLTSQLGGLLRGFDYTQQEAADTSIQIAKLGSDLAAAYGGSVTDAVDALGAALRGEFNPLERFGVAMNVAQIEAYALENGLAATKSQIDLSTRATAALALINERTADIQGQFTRELSTAGGVMSTTRAVMQGLADEAGAALLPGLIALAETLRDDAGPALFDLANVVFPLITTSLEAFAPLLGSTTQLLAAATPIIEAVGNVLDMIPTPILTIATGLLTLNKAISMVPWAKMAGGLKLASDGTGLLASGLKLVTAHPFLAAAAGVTALGAAIVLSDDGWSGFQENITNTFQGLLGIETNAEKAKRSIAQMTEGLDLNTYAGLDQAVENLNTGLAEFRKIQEDLDIPTPDWVEDFNEDLKQSAIEQLNAATASGALSDAIQFQVNELAMSNATTEEWVALLGRAQPDIQRHAAAVAGLEEKYAEIREVAGLSAEGLEELMTGSDGVSVALLNLQSGAGDTEEQLLNLALAAGQGAVSEEQMADLAGVLGVELDSLEGFIEDVNGALEDFVSTAMNNIPEVGDAFRDMNEDGIIGVQDFTRALEEDAMKVAAFHANIAAITDAGYTNLAAIVAQKGPEAGALIAQELADAVATGNTELLDNVTATVEQTQQVYDSMEEYLRTNLGPRFILTSGLLGSSASSAFGANLSFGERIELAGFLAEQQMTEEGKAIAAIAATEGEDAARAYGQMLDLDSEVVNEGVRVGNAFRNMDTSGAAAAGANSGGAYVAGLIGGILGMQARALATAQSLANKIRDTVNLAWLVRSPSRVAMESGSMFGQGLALGISSQEDAVVAAAEQIARDAAAGLDTGMSVSPIGLDAAAGVSAAVDRYTSVTGGQRPTDTGSDVTVRLVVEDQYDGMVRRLRQDTKIKSGGSVQAFIGSGQGV